MSRLRQNSAIVAVLQAQVVLGLCCVGGFLLFDASFGKGALAGFASVFIPSIIMAWQHSRTTQASRLLGQSVVKMVTTAALMAISFGVWVVNPVSFQHICGYPDELPHSAARANNGEKTTANRRIATR